jgi:transcriptional regulator with XRE-family HTH domain
MSQQHTGSSETVPSPEMAPRKPRRRTHDGKPRAADAYVGHKLRQRRTLLGMSQESVAAAIGLTLQQIQKYENGTNRVGASRLWDLAQVLGCDVSYFFDGFEENGERLSDPAGDPTASAAAETEAMEEDQKEETTTDPIMIRRETWELVRAYYLITDGRVRRRLRNLACSLAAKEEAMAN